MKVKTVCYTLNTPKVYNKGTRYEKTEDTFLLCYGDEDTMKAIQEDYEQARVRGMKREDYDDVKFFFVNVQEELY